MDYSRQYLTFESKTNNNVISWIAEAIAGGGITAKTISASTDNGNTWTAYTSTTGGTTIATLNVGDKVLIKGENRAYGYGSVNKFGSTGQFKAYGNVMSLLYGDNFVGQRTLTNENTYAFQSLFHGCSGLISAENLILPATTLANGCYISMFNRTSITIAPELPATTLTVNCYRWMFYNCSSLNYIKCLATDISPNSDTYNWVSGVASTGTFVKNSAATWTTGVNGIPIGWVVKNDREDDTTQCGYTIADLERGEIYLFDSISGLSDNGVLTNDALVLSGLNIEFSEEETLNERYRFTKSVSFSIKGYGNLNLLNGRRYIAVKNGDGRVVLVTTEFPAAVTYEYNLSSSDDTTRYTFAAQDNIPSTFVDYNGNITRIADDVCSYFSPDIELSYILTKFINVNELTDRAIIYDGEWDTIKAIRNSVEVNETLSNDRYTKTISFRILHSNDWQYLIGEFKNNLYTVKVNSHKTKNLYVGNEFGLQPLYSIDGNVVTITLTEIANMPLVRLTNEEKSQIVGHRYIKTDFDPCSANERAQYVLREKVDGNGNGTGEYECYTGYENIFDDYNITGTFSDIYTYYNAACKSENCTISTEIPPRVVFFECWGPNNNKKNQFAFRADCDWEVISGYTVTPTSGTANTDYTLTVPKHYYDAGGSNVEETNIIQAGDTQFKFDYVYYGDAEHNAPVYGLTNNIDYYIDCNGGYISLKANTEMIDWNNVNWTRFDLPLTYSDGFINIYIPPNTYTYDLEFDFEFESDDYTCGRNVIRIHQSRVWEFWAYNNDCEYICENGNKYHKEWRYTGTTSSNAVITDTFRKGDLMETNCRDCQTIYTKWEQTYNILCVDGVAFFVDLQYESTDNANWTLSGGVRLREQATNASIDACINPEYEWRITENTVCDN